MRTEIREGPSGAGERKARGEGQRKWPKAWHMVTKGRLLHHSDMIFGTEKVMSTWKMEGRRPSKEIKYASVTWEMSPPGPPRVLEPWEAESPVISLALMSCLVTA